MTVSLIAPSFKRSFSAQTVLPIGTLVALTILVLGVASAAFAAHPKIAKDLEDANGFAPVDVIVQFTQTPTAHHHQLAASRGGILKRDLSIIKSAHYSISSFALQDLANDPEVAYNHTRPPRPG